MMLEETVTQLVSNLPIALILYYVWRVDRADCERIMSQYRDDLLHYRDEYEKLAQKFISYLASGDVSASGDSGKIE